MARPYSRNHPLALSENSSCSFSKEEKQNFFLWFQKRPIFLTLQEENFVSVFSDDYVSSHLLQIRKALCLYCKMGKLSVGFENKESFVIRPRRKTSFLLYFGFIARFQEFARDLYVRRF